MSLRLVTTAVAVLLISAPAWADTLSVPKDHATIQEAVNAAGDGDVIEIKGGKYNEEVTIAAKTNLTLVGKGNVTIIASEDNAILATGCSGLTIQKIKAEGGDTCFQFENCTNVLLEKFGAKNAQRHGVFAVGSSNVRVIKGKIKDVGIDGVSFADEEPQSPVNGGEVTKVKVIDPGEDGVDILGSNVTVTRCLVRDANDDSFESDLDAAGNIEFRNCKSRNSVDEGFELYAPNTKATDCQSTRARDDGFDVEGAGSVITNCKSTKDGGNGFEAEITSNVSFVDCTTVRADDDGIAILDSDNCTIDGCKSLRSGFDGIYIDEDSDGTTIRDCKAVKNRDSDLDDEGTNTTLEGDNKFKEIDPNN